MNKPDMELSLQRLRKKGFQPIHAIDVGACKGEVTRMIKRVFAQAAVLMIEPNNVHNRSLKKICSDYPDCQYINALLGAKEREKVNFLLSGPYSCVIEGGLMPGQKSIRMPMTTLDKLTADKQFLRPDLLKIDVQGYELEVLKGAESLMDTLEVIIIEISINTNEEAPSFYDTAKFMDEHGLRLYDICTFFYRPFDNAFWQIDAIFLRNSSPLAAGEV